MPARALLPPVVTALSYDTSGCPGTARAAALPGASFPYLGVACGLPNRTDCDRVRIGVHLRRPAILVTVQVDGRLVAPSPPADPGDDLWEGALLHAGVRRGPLAVRARHGRWYGDPAVRPHVGETAYFADGSVATRAGIGFLQKGYG